MDLQHHTVATDIASLHVVETGSPSGKPIVLLHGWPQAWHSWRRVMEHASAETRPPRLLAFDLPGVGGSTRGTADGTKLQAADAIRQALEQLDVEAPIVVGQDWGGMVAYAYTRSFPNDVRGAVVMNTVVPGVDPWDHVLANPYVWHFAFHSIPELPELLVGGKQRAYFDYFYDVLSADASRITDADRELDAAAYASLDALASGFDAYRAMRHDAVANETSTAGECTTPLLYLRGGAEHVEVELYVRGLQRAGCRDVRTASIADAGHFAHQEQPAAVWDVIHAFASDLAPLPGRTTARAAQ